VSSNLTTVILRFAESWSSEGSSRVILRALVMARLAQLVERKALNLVVVGSSPTVGVIFFRFDFRMVLSASLVCQTKIYVVSHAGIE
jgi:hypothetical protein